MEKKGSRQMRDSQRNESSLLLQSGSLVTWSDLPGNSLFMPVAVQTAEENETNHEAETQQLTEVSKASSMENKPLFSSPMTAQHCSSISVSQLQQPLMVRKSPSPQPNNTVSSTSYVNNQPNVASAALRLFQSTQPATVKSVSSPFVQPVPVSSIHQGGISEKPNSSYYALHEHLSASCNSSFSHKNSDITVPASGGYASSDFSTTSTAPEYASANAVYSPVHPYWFYKDIVESKELWYGFSSMDSASIEEAHQNALKSQSCGDEIIVPTIGRRYDVYLRQREKKAVYWEEKVQQVRRCTWFYKSEGVQRYVPYDEITANSIEEAYQKCIVTGNWHQRILLNGEVIVLEGPHTVLHYAHGLDTWSTVDAKTSPRVVVRGVPAEITILPDEAEEMDHLVFIVQGIGSVCDLRFRSVSQCVDGFREIANRLVPIHFKNDFDAGRVHRVEFLPLAWHSSLHTDNDGLDRRMKSITLTSIPKLRHFTNDTLLDILLYSSPLYCQAVINTVTNGLNELFNLFMSRNPQFKGKVSVAGHSLGSLILFDILTNQVTAENTTETMQNAAEEVNHAYDANDLNLQNSSSTTVENTNIDSSPTMTSVFEELGLQEYLDEFLAEKMDLESLLFCDEKELEDLGLQLGPRKKLLQRIKSIQSEMNKPDATNISAHSENVQRSEHLSTLTSSDTLLSKTQSPKQFSLSVYPVNPPHYTLSSVTFPRLDFDPAHFFALGSPIAMFLAVRGFSTISENFQFPTCSSFFHVFHPYDPVAFRIETLIDPNFSAEPVLIPHHKGRKRMHIEIRENITKMGIELKQKLLETLKFTWEHLNVFSRASYALDEAVKAEVDKLVQEEISDANEDNRAFPLDVSGENLKIGCLNRGRRIDYVLQEKPIEALNEYIFALTSHATYWDSEDTVLMILKEIYSVQGIIPLHIAGEMKEDIDRYLPSQEPCSTKPPLTVEAIDKAMYHLSYPPVSESPYPTDDVPVTNLRHPAFGVAVTEVLSNTMSDRNTSNIVQPAALSSQPLVPPPLSGFVKKSPFGKP